MRVRRQATLGSWSAEFDPREFDVAGTDFVVVVEVWERNDYRVDIDLGFSGTVLDIGANIGAFSVLASKAGANRVIAVEPEAGNLDRLVHHVTLNRRENVTMLHAAVTPTGGEVVTMVGVGGGARSIPASDETFTPVTSTVTLADLVETYGPIEMMKMDIEGGEFAIFDALHPDVLPNIDRIAMEWHGPASPHLAHLRGDEFGPLVAKLAQRGRVETIGRPDFGGLLHWTRY